MKNTNIQKLTIASVLCAVAVVGSLFSFPVFGSKCAPVQHMVNIICAVMLGPGYGVAVAFCASLLRNLLGLGSLMAFPGSMVGAFLCGILFRKTGKLAAAYAGEMAGTGILGGLLCYPVAAWIMGKEVALFFYVIPFLMSTVCGTVIAAVLIGIMKQSGAFYRLKELL